MRKQYAKVGWSAVHVQEIAEYNGVTLTTQQAEAWLKENEETLINYAIRDGEEMIESMLTDPNMDGMPLDVGALGVVA